MADTSPTAVKSVSRISSNTGSPVVQLFKGRPQCSSVQAQLNESVNLSSSGEGRDAKNDNIRGNSKVTVVENTKQLHSNDIETGQDENDVINDNDEFVTVTSIDLQPSHPHSTPIIDSSQLVFPDIQMGYFDSTINFKNSAFCSGDSSASVKSPKETHQIVSQEGVLSLEKYTDVNHCSTTDADNLKFKTAAVDKCDGKSRSIENEDDYRYRDDADLLQGTFCSSSYPDKKPFENVEFVKNRNKENRLQFYFRQCSDSESSSQVSTEYDESVEEEEGIINEPVGKAYEMFCNDDDFLNVNIGEENEEAIKDDVKNSERNEKTHNSSAIDSRNNFGVYHSTNYPWTNEKLTGGGDALYATAQSSSCPTRNDCQTSSETKVLPPTLTRPQNVNACPQGGGGEIPLITPIPPEKILAYLKSYSNVRGLNKSLLNTEVGSSDVGHSLSKPAYELGKPDPLVAFMQGIGCHSKKNWKQIDSDGNFYKEKDFSLSPQHSKKNCLTGVKRHKRQIRCDADLPDESQMSDEEMATLISTDPNIILSGEGMKPPPLNIEENQLINDVQDFNSKRDKEDGSEEVLCQVMLKKGTYPNKSKTSAARKVETLLEWIINDVLPQSKKIDTDLELYPKAQISLKDGNGEKNEISNLRILLEENETINLVCAHTIKCLRKVIREFKNDLNNVELEEESNLSDVDNSSYVNTSDSMEDAAIELLRSNEDLQPFSVSFLSSLNQPLSILQSANFVSFLHKISLISGVESPIKKNPYLEEVIVSSLQGTHNVNSKGKKTEGVILGKDNEFLISIMHFLYQASIVKSVHNSDKTTDALIKKVESNSASAKNRSLFITQGKHCDLSSGDTVNLLTKMNLDKQSETFSQQTRTAPYDTDKMLNKKKIYQGSATQVIKKDCAQKRSIQLVSDGEISDNIQPAKDGTGIGSSVDLCLKTILAGESSKKPSIDVLPFEKICVTSPESDQVANVLMEMQKNSQHQTPSYFRTERSAQRSVLNLSYIVPQMTPSPFEIAVWNIPSIITLILTCLGDPGAVCRMKMVSKFCNRVITDNEYTIMKDAVRLGGINSYQRPAFWLWIALEKYSDNKRQSLECKNVSASMQSYKVENSVDDFEKLERIGREGKWNHIIIRDVTRAFGNMPPHKACSRLQSKSIVRALVACGNGHLLRRNVNGPRRAMSAPSCTESKKEEPLRRLSVTPHVWEDSVIDDESEKRGESLEQINTVSDWNGISPERQVSKTPKDSRIDTNRDLVLSSNGLTHDMKLDLQKKLEFILNAIAAAHPNVGYCQGMDYVAAHLLRILQETIEFNASKGKLPYNIQSTKKYDNAVTTNDNAIIIAEGVFRVMDTFLTKYNLRHMYWPELRCLKTCCRVFEHLIEKKLPVLADHFDHHELNVGLFALGWFQTLFLYIPSMPSATINHMWDIWLVERSMKIFFRIGTAILFLSQPILLNSELEGMMQYLNTFPDATLLNPDILIKCALQIKITNQMLTQLEMDVARDNELAHGTNQHDIDERYRYFP